jgi:hypothetical protein
MGRPRGRNNLRGISRFGVQRCGVSLSNEPYPAVYWFAEAEADDDLFSRTPRF